jgi:hypothetical protein
VLEQRASGRGWAKVDFDITSDKSHRFISLPDMGLLKKLTGVRPKEGIRIGKSEQISFHPAPGLIKVYFFRR